MYKIYENNCYGVNYFIELMHHKLKKDLVR